MNATHWAIIIKGQPFVAEDEYPPDEPVEEVQLLHLQIDLTPHVQHPPPGWPGPPPEPAHVLSLQWTDYTGRNWRAAWFLNDEAMQLVCVPMLIRRVDLADKGLVEVWLDAHREWSVLLKHEGMNEGKAWQVPPLPASETVPVQL